MQRLTPEQFYESLGLPKFDKYDKRTAKFDYFDMLDFAEKYAAHCEETGWVTDGSLPFQIPDSYISGDCAVDCGFGKKYIGYYHFQLNQWRNSSDGKIIDSPIIRYCQLPTPPKQ